MANVDRNNGFRPAYNANGSPYNGQSQMYYSLSDNLAVGDVVVADTAGNGKYRTVDRASNGATDIMVGVVTGFEVNPDNLNNNYHTASADYGVMICDDPNIIFEAQADDATLTSASLGLNVDFTTTAIAVLTGLSGMEVDGSSAVVTAATPWRLIGFVDKEDNDETLTNARVLVKPNMHKYLSDTGASVGV